jgi:hypothetical protein
VGEIDLAMDWDSACRWTAVKALAEELNITADFIPPGLAGLVQPLDRMLMGGQKAVYRAVYGYEMWQREDKRVTEADLAWFQLLAWEQVSEGAVAHGWDWAMLAHELEGEDE